MKLRHVFGLVLLVGSVNQAAAAERLLTIDPVQSRIEFGVKATMGSFVGVLSAYEAQITIDEAVAVKSAALTFKFSELTTGEEKRDRHMHEWQDSSAHPDCRFELTRLTSQADGSHLAEGNFTLHGLTRPLSFPVRITTEGQRLILDGEAVVNTVDFGLPIIRKFLALKVNPEVVVRFHLQGAVPAGV